MGAEREILGLGALRDGVTRARAAGRRRRLRARDDPLHRAGGLLVGGALGYALDVKNVYTMNVEYYTGVDERLEVPRILPPAPDFVDLDDARILIADDVADTGNTLRSVQEFCAGKVGEVRIAVLYEKPALARRLRLRVAAYRPVDQLPLERQGPRRHARRRGARRLTSIGSPGRADRVRNPRLALVCQVEPVERDRGDGMTYSQPSRHPNGASTTSSSGTPSSRWRSAKCWAECAIIRIRRPSNSRTMSSRVLRILAQQSR